MIINISGKRKNKKYYICLNEYQLKQICRILNEKSESLIAENNLKSEMYSHKIDLIIKKLISYLKS